MLLQILLHPRLCTLYWHFAHLFCSWLLGCMYIYCSDGKEDPKAMSLLTTQKWRFASLLTQVGDTLRQRRKWIRRQRQGKRQGHTPMETETGTDCIRGPGRTRTHLVALSTITCAISCVHSHLLPVLLMRLRVYLQLPPGGPDTPAQPPPQFACKTGLS